MRTTALLLVLAGTTVSAGCARADLLLIDNWDGRIEAERRHLRAVGTLRVLADGAGRGLVDLEVAF